MAELEPESDSSRVTRGALFYIGASALMIVVIVETLAVIGRHIGWPLLGALEIIQAAILISACAATVIATLNTAHATVHLLTQRLNERWRLILLRLSAFLATLFFIGLAIGAVWLGIDFWNAHEESELLHLSFRPLRAAVALSAASAAFIFAYRIIVPKRSTQ